MSRGQQCPPRGIVHYIYVKTADDWIPDNSIAVLIKKIVSCTDHKRGSELVAEHGIDERIDGTVSETGEVYRQHRKQKVLLQ